MSDLDLDLLGHKLDLLIEGRAATPRFLSIPAAADHASLSEPSIRRLLSAGKINRYSPVPGRVCVDRLELESYILGTSGNGTRRGRGRRAGRGS